MLFTLRVGSNMKYILILSLSISSFAEMSRYEYRKIIKKNPGGSYPAKVIYKASKNNLRESSKTVSPGGEYIAPPIKKK